MIFFQAPIPSKLSKYYQIQKSPIPEDILVQAGKSKSDPVVRIQSAGTGQFY